jgi:hypothetical protein
MVIVVVVEFLSLICSQEKRNNNYGILGCRLLLSLKQESCSLCHTNGEVHRQERRTESTQTGDSREGEKERVSMRDVAEQLL